MRVAIVGAGPSGSALAILLARQGARVTLFDDGRRPELLVGESLVPAVIPILQRLGLEETTASFSRVKPGVSFIWSPTDRFSFSFARFSPGVFPYAYNIPRPRFDDAVLARAVACGVERVVAHARLEPVSEGGRELGLAPETLAAAPTFEGRQPDLVVDATGRARLGARALNIGADLGPRKDVAHFARPSSWPTLWHRSRRRARRRRPRSSKRRSGRTRPGRPRCSARGSIWWRRSTTDGWRRCSGPDATGWRSEPTP